MRCDATALARGPRRRRPLAQSCDNDRDGKVTKSEFVAAMKRSDLVRGLLDEPLPKTDTGDTFGYLFNEIDTDGSAAM